jgi:hypothetical protein
LPRPVRPLPRPALVAQLLLDLPHLLAQQDFTLAIVDRFLGLLLDLARESQHLDALGEVRGDLLEAFAHLDRLEDLLLLGRLDVEMKLAMVSASVEGDSIDCTLYASSAGACGSSEMASTAFCFR